MSDNQWEEFIEKITKQEKKVNLKKQCQEKQVGLNTLYRKVANLQETNMDLYQKFISLYPYKPRDTQGIDFEQLMRESIITGISQKGLQEKYDISKRTIQRQFATIEQENPELYSIYQMYVEALKAGKELNPSILDKVVSEYIPQQVKSTEEKLKERRKKFIESYAKFKK